MKQKTLLKKVVFVLSLLFSMIPFMIQLRLTQQEKKSKTKDLSLKKWKGLWVSDKGDLLLEISEKSNIFMNNSPLELTLQNILNNELLFQDQYGYSINITKKNEYSLLLFDEAEQKEYLFSRIAK
ncbi:DUF4828 domain-containing protein [Jeotgalibaca sp. MA1X17-3]|uniref:DUF4828 domain-containing protein n=1 Tax=Jeotgalibaca sp. MA1X17-3 TaxID=2908211 RepID=UPI001F3C4E31|nr:DUF4828 domain-containing protein [Jeotgalibaca sp. MA1X17-3]UJF16530.1 DUF4828 domain-containing protein [Jeotgalibaca sp. MA1X17-3]